MKEIHYTKRLNPLHVLSFYKETDFVDNWRDYFISLPHNKLPQSFSDEDLKISIHYSHEVSTGEGRYNCKVSVGDIQLMSTRFPTYDEAVNETNKWIFVHYLDDF